MSDTLERVWRGYGLGSLPKTDFAVMVYRELEIEIIRLQRASVQAVHRQLLPADDPDDDYVPNLHNADIA